MRAMAGRGLAFEEDVLGGNVNGEEGEGEAEEEGGG